MRTNYYKFFLMIISCCFLFACQTEVKTTPTAAPAPVEKPKSDAVATPSNISRPDKMVNNFQRMQGEWRQEDMFNNSLQVRGRVFLEITEGKDRAKRSSPFEVVKNCEGEMDRDGSFFMVGKRCFKLLNISIEEMEVEDVAQQKVIKYVRI